MTQTKHISYADTSIATFEERNRVGILLYDDRDHTELYDLWDGDLHDALQSGFVRYGRKSSSKLSEDDEVLHRSLYDYAVDLGVIAVPK